MENPHIWHRIAWTKSTLLRGLWLLAVAATARGDDVPDPKTLPAPPSIAVNPAALPATARVALVVDAIPPDAKYVIYAEMALDGVTLTAEQAGKVGAELSGTFEQLFAMARQRGANLIVLLSNEHGVEVPIRQCARPLRLRPRDPRVVAVLFQSPEAAGSGALVPRVRFTTRLAGRPKEAIGYRITLARNTAGVTKAHWTYGNLARFVADAVAGGFDTVAIKSSSDTPSEEVWLPGCDEPVRIASAQAVLDVTIYRSATPGQPAGPAPSTGASAATHP